MRLPVSVMLTHSSSSLLAHPLPHWSFSSALVLHCPLSHTSFALPHRWLYGKTVCSVYAFCGMLFGICSLTTLTLLGVVCFVKVCYPLYGKSSKKLFSPRWNDTWISHHIPKWLIVDLSVEANEMIIPHEALHISLPLIADKSRGCTQYELLVMLANAVQLGLLLDLEKSVFPGSGTKGFRL